MDAPVVNTTERAALGSTDLRSPISEEGRWRGAPPAAQSMQHVSRISLFCWIVALMVGAPSSAQQCPPAFDLISVAHGGQAAANGPTEEPSVSADGYRVAFSSSANNLHDPNGPPLTGSHNAYLYDRRSKTMQVATRTFDGSTNHHLIHDTRISGNGRYVVFSTENSSLVPGDNNGQRDVFRFDSYTGQTIRVSVPEEEAKLAGAGPDANSFSQLPDINYAGDVVVFTSAATNLVAEHVLGPPPGGGAKHAYRTEIEPDGDISTQWLSGPCLQNNCGGVGVWSYAQVNDSGDLSVVMTGSTRILGGTTWPNFYLIQDGQGITHAAAETGPINLQFNNRWHQSGQGASVFFRTTTQLVPDDTNTWDNLYRWRAGLGFTLVDPGGGGPKDPSSDEAGEVVSWWTQTPLTGAGGGLFRRDLNLPPAFERVGPIGVTTASSARSDVVAFRTPAWLVPEDTNGHWDIYVHDLGLASQPGPGSGPCGSSILRVDVVDPRPDRTGPLSLLAPGAPSGLTSDPATLAIGGVHARGVVTDGVAQGVLRVFVAEPGVVTFSVRDEFGDPTLDAGSLADIGAPHGVGDPSIAAATQQLPDGRHAAFALLRAPDEFVRSNFPGDQAAPSRSVTLEVSYTSTSGTTETDQVPLQLRRPPLMLLHGIWSSGDAWSHPLMESPRFTITTPDLDEPDGPFRVNLYSLPFHLYSARQSAQREGYIAVRSDVVAHSMGGVLSRLFVDGSMPASVPYHRADNYAFGDIRRLLLLDSPQQGSPMANLLVMLGQDPDVGPSIRSLACLADMCIDRGAVRDLQVGSPANEGMRGAVVNAHAFVGIGGEAFILSAPGCQPLPPHRPILSFLRLLLGSAWNAVFGGPHDLIVGMDSQLAGLGPSAATFFDLEACHERTGHHLQNTSGDDRYDARIVELLNSRFEDGELADLLPAPPGTDEPQQTVSTLGGTVENGIAVQIVSSPPPPLRPGDILEIEVGGLNGFQPARTFVFLGTEAGYSEDAFPSVRLVVPDSATDQIELGAAAVDSSDRLTTSESLTLLVEPAGPAVALRVHPAELVTVSGGQARLKVLATSADGVERQLEESDFLVTSADECVGAPLAPGLIASLTPGGTQLLVSHASLSEAIPLIATDFGGLGAVPDLRPLYADAFSLDELDGRHEGTELAALFPELGLSRWRGSGLFFGAHGSVYRAPGGPGDAWLPIQLPNCPAFPRLNARLTLYADSSNARFGFGQGSLLAEPWLWVELRGLQYEIYLAGLSEPLAEGAAPHGVPPGGGDGPLVDLSVHVELSFDLASEELVVDLNGEVVWLDLSGYDVATSVSSVGFGFLGWAGESAGDRSAEPTLDSASNFALELAVN